MSTFTRRGHELCVEHRRGAAGRPPLVLCAGIGAGMRLFDPLVAALDPERPLIRFDVPGIGGSPTSRLPYRYSSLAATLRQVVGDLGYRHADVLGISWGGGLAQQYAAQHPRHCRRLVLVATGTGSLMVPARPRTLARMLTPRRHRDPSYAHSVAGGLYGGSARADPAATVAALHAGGARPSTRAYLYQLLAIATWTSLPFLPLIRQPTLVMAGDDDPLIPAANGTVMSRLLPRGLLHRYRGGHLALLTEAETLAPVIETFLDGPADG